jgi:Ca2+-binding RTX toxin-like protein
VNPIRPRAARRVRGFALFAATLVVAGALPTVASAAEGDIGTIVIVQSTIPEGPQDFHYTSDIPELSVFALDDDDDGTLSHEITAADIAAGEYTVYQDDPPVGWGILGVSCNDPDNGSNTYTNGVLIDLDAGESITCTFTDSPTTGDVAIHLDTSPDDPVAFDFTADWGTFTLNDDGSDADFMWPDMYVNGLLPGSYALAQGAADGWNLTGLTCSDPDGGTNTDPATGSVTLDVDGGEVVECWFTNEPAAAPPPPPAPNAVNITLDAVPNNAVDVPFAFGDILAFTLDDDADGTLSNLKTYADMDLGPWPVTAQVPAGWRVANVACTDPDGGTTVDKASARANVDLDDGETVSCTFTIEPIPVAPPSATCNGKAATIVAQPGVSSVRGTQGADVIVALAGNVRIDGRGGNDTICAGPGDNIINGGGGADWIDAGDGTNTVDGGAGNDAIIAGSGNDTLLGGTGNDDVSAGDGNNLVSTGSGDDDIATGAGDDRIDGGKDYDTCQPGGGSNSVNRCEA